LKLVALTSTPVACVLLLLVGLVVIVAPGHRTPALASSLEGCAPQHQHLSGIHLGRTQWRVVRVIVAVGRSLGVPPQGLVIAITAGLQESGLRPLRYGDRDSLGVFQQRAAWGSAAARINPSTAARLFFTGGRAGQRGLLDVPGWQHLSIAGAAQAVEVSAHPRAYAKWTSLSVAVVRHLTGPDSGSESDSGCSPGRWVSPLGNAHYVLTAGFGECGALWADCHTGQDFAVPTGTRVFAVGAGVVTFAGWNGPYGNAVHLLRADGTATWYAHLSQIRTRRGSRVRGGTLLGLSGATGNTTGPHLHFEVRIRASSTNPGIPVDPMPWLHRRHIL
jgi:murein DD-endopeptidase MepM/ murein hydrolase activator NlpD